MSTSVQQLDVESLLSANRKLMQVLSDGDERAFARVLHPDFIINAPHNISGDRSQILKLSHGGVFAKADRRIRVERSIITDNVGIVMGDELVTPSEQSLLAAWFGTRPLRQRFTNVFVHTDGQWLLLARQASAVREAEKTSRLM